MVKTEPGIMTQGLSDGIGGTLKPVCRLLCLFSREYCYKPFFPETVEPVGSVDMAIQTGAVELGQHEDPADIAVKAIGNRDVNKTVFAVQRNCGFGAQFSQWI